MGDTLAAALSAKRAHDITSRLAAGVRDTKLEATFLGSVRVRRIAAIN